MRNLSRLTLTAALLGTLALPALAQGNLVNGAAPVSTRHHRVVKPSRQLHHIAATSTDAVRTPAVTATSSDAKPGLDGKPGLAAKPATAGTLGATAAAPVTTTAPRLTTQAPLVPSAAKPN